ncbi:MAG: ferredoxin [Oxalobacteraceae bacterium]|nr:MAG: ferredoxin [Oxalobacteraceae bacterium]
MPDPNDKHRLNVSGRYYNDSNCIDCDMCHEIAPETFRRDEDEGFCFLFRQPSTPQEIAAAEDARLACPVEAIGNDG